MRKLNRSSSVIVALLAIIVGAAVIAAWPKPTPHRVGLPSYCANGRVPSACIFGLAHSPYVVLSAYAYEASLLDGDIPVGDYDYMLPAGSERVRLPGGSWNRYSYQGAVYVPGSGWVAKFITPNGGHFALLHLQIVNGAGVRTAPLANLPLGLPPPVLSTTRSGDDNTAVVAARLFAAAPHLVGVGRGYRGGDAVGWSGWPTWSIYANGGPGGPADSHLCVLLSGRALAFFWKVASGQDHKPRHFPVKRWGKTPYKDRHGRLVWSASWTYHHHQTSIYPHLRGDRWFGHTATRRYGYGEYHFRGSRQGHLLTCWPHYKRCKLSAR